MNTKDKYKFLGPTVLISAVLVAFPFVYMLYTSFQSRVAFQPYAGFAGIGNYRSLVQSSEFTRSLITTAAFVIGSVLLSLLIGLALALILHEHVRKRGLFLGLLTIPAIVPPAAAGFAWKFLLHRDVGVLGGYLLPKLGLEKAILGDAHWALGSIIVADIWCQTPLMLLILLAGLQALPIEVFEAARIDGASYWQRLQRITLPLLKPVLAVAVIMRFIFAFTAFDVIFTMTRGGPGIATQTLPFLGWKTGFMYYDFGQASALAVIMLVITVVLSMVLVRMVRT